ncbi:MAG: helix-hairpin-helix domain-containing protein, partial [Chitinophagaceae bacterium]|nr:helix-hairpin-helix domain-containing protein [Chitinophagaceae bacterium]
EQVNRAFSDTGSDSATPENVVNSHSAYRSNRNRDGPKVYRKQKIEPFDINSADTTLFIALPGIGSKLAARIVTFREKLGGFYSVKQIGEVYGLQDSVFKKIAPFFKCDVAKVRRININVAGKNELSSHPYIRWNIAEAVIAYRNQHGNFSSADDLFRIENIDAGALERMMPYLSFK